MKICVATHISDGCFFGSANISFTTPYFHLVTSSFTGIRFGGAKEDFTNAGLELGKRFTCDVVGSGFNPFFDDNHTIEVFDGFYVYGYDCYYKPNFRAVRSEHMMNEDESYWFTRGIRNTLSAAKIILMSIV